MGKRGNHYDAAFEEYLRHARTPYVFVDESRRARLAEASLKSFDFIVHSDRRPNLLVDVKGRRFPSGGTSHRHKWENWVTMDDVSSMLEWTHFFGRDFRPLFVFAYHIVDPQYLPEFDSWFTCRNRTYAFYGVWADQYREQMRHRSARWETVSLPSGIFQDLRSPIEKFL